jgi:hypothetical protein
MKKFYVYLWRDPSNQTPRYIGKGSGKRVWDHLYDPKNMKYQIHNMLAKRFEQGLICLPSIVWVESESEALELETLMIRTIGRFDLGEGPLFNLTDGGEGISGLIRTEEHCRKISAATKGKPRGPVSPIEKERLRQLALGRVHSREERDKRSASLKARPPFTLAHRQAIAEGGKRRAPISDETRKRLSESLKRAHAEGRH